MLICKHLINISNGSCAKEAQIEYAAARKINPESKQTKSLRLNFLETMTNKWICIYQNQKLMLQGTTAQQGCPLIRGKPTACSLTLSWGHHPQNIFLLRPIANSVMFSKILVLKLVQRLTGPALHACKERAFATTSERHDHTIDCMHFLFVFDSLSTHCCIF